MLNLTHTLKLSALSSLLALSAVGLTAQSASADDFYGRVRCDRDGDRCYRVQRDDDDYRSTRWRRERYDDGYSYSYSDYHTVCDSDGDRCYRSRGSYWNYREYYRRHGYHWED